jgi:GTP-binding protein Era
VDTPGIHRPRTALGERLNALATASLTEADAAIFVIEATGKIGPGDRLIATRLLAAGLATVCVINKTDAAQGDAVLERLGTAGEWGFAGYVPVSATAGTNLEPIVTEVAALLSDGPRYFPEGMTSDQADEFLIGEIVREKFSTMRGGCRTHCMLVEEVFEQDNGCRVMRESWWAREPEGIVIGPCSAQARRNRSPRRLGVRPALIHLDLR